MCTPCVQLHGHMLAAHGFMRVRCRGHRGGGDGRVMGFCARHDLLTAALLLVARCTHTLRRLNLERGGVAFMHAVRLLLLLLLLVRLTD